MQLSATPHLTSIFCFYLILKHKYKWKDKYKFTIACSVMEWIGSLFLYYLPPMWILIYSQYYKRAHVYKFYINSIVAYETRKMQVVWRKMWKCIKDYCVFLPRGLDVAVRGGSRIRCWRQLWGGDNSAKVKEHQRITCICTLVFISFVYLVCNCICFVLYGICSALMMAIW